MKWSELNWIPFLVSDGWLWSTQRRTIFEGVTKKVAVMGTQVAPSNISLEGYLFKQGDINKAWQRRYFILKWQSIYYFQEKPEPNPEGVYAGVKGVVDLINAKVQSPCHHSDHLTPICSTPTMSPPSTLPLPFHPHLLYPYYFTPIYTLPFHSILSHHFFVFISILLFSSSFNSYEWTRECVCDFTEGGESNVFALRRVRPRPNQMVSPYPPISLNSNIAHVTTGWKRSKER